MEVFIATIFIIALFIIIMKGAVNTFRRQPVVAILCIIFLFPIWLIWAFIEGFM